MHKIWAQLPKDRSVIFLFIRELAPWSAWAALLNYIDQRVCATISNFTSCKFLATEIRLRNETELRYDNVSASKNNELSTKISNQLDLKLYIISMICQWLAMAAEPQKCRLGDLLASGCKQRVHHQLKGFCYLLFTIKLSQLLKFAKP